MLPPGDPVWPRADAARHGGIAAPAVSGDRVPHVPRDDADMPGRVVQLLGVGARETEHQGRIRLRLDGEPAKVPPRGGIEYAVLERLERERHILGRDRGAVVPSRSRAEPEAPGE